MKILVWNARGLDSNRAFQVLLRLKQTYKPDLIFLIETKSDHYRMEIIKVKLGFPNKLVVNNIGRSRGLCLMWSNLADVSPISYSQFHIDVQIVSHRNVCWRWTSFYGNPDVNERQHRWTLLRGLSRMSNLPWVCAGDFTEILNENEKVGGVCRTKGRIERFRETLDECGLQDLGFMGPSFTWCDKRDREEMIQERLDRCVVTLE
ncbi:hypothetical protein Ddye_028361 [Dipteronia dyeriana]|uniref:Endonuclease/exonuclease/phosphatase domain-containing protein n=1 Tax=Dipteronia dyeriana TaxID=168575 RepID=A0AAD9TRI7_9ROSI|nr:hypothetical protein Ddye_028361 [Dipteronia dyeriana]